MKNKNLITPRPSGGKKPSDQYVPFDGEKLGQICKKKSLSMTRLSIVLCNRSSNFLSTAIRRGTIDKEALQVLCDGLGIDINDLLAKPEKPEQPIERYYLKSYLVPPTVLDHLDNYAVPPDRIKPDLATLNEILTKSGLHQLNRLSTFGGEYEVPWLYKDCDNTDCVHTVVAHTTTGTGSV